MKRYLLFILTSFVSLILSAQTKRDIKDFVSALVSNDTSILRIENIDYLGSIDIGSYLENEIEGITVSDDSLFVVNRRVVINNCRFEHGLHFDRFWFKKGIFIRSKPFPSGYRPDYFEQPFSFRNCKIESGLECYIDEGDNNFIFNIDNCRLKGGIKCEVYGSLSIRNSNLILSEDELEFAMDNSQRRANLFIRSAGQFSVISNNTFDYQFDRKSTIPIKFLGYIESNSDRVKYENNVITSNVNADNIDNENGFWIVVGEKTTSFSLNENKFNVDIKLDLTFGLNQLKIHSNKFLAIGFNPFKIPTEDSYILWDDLAKSDLGLLSLKEPFYNGQTPEQIKDFVAFRQIIKFYKSLYDLYKANGDIQSANAVYIKIKDFETNELKLKYEENPSLNLGFMIQINRILKFYTAYGTNPAKSLVISMYIIFAFACFYFFFPSDWDVTSKSKLIQNFKDFIQKNEKGYIKPFFILITGFLISLINALTLSLNAFTTLGFGNIPTSGIARYVCVFQGFLGWFLLSLFTVALINQVSF